MSHAEMMSARRRRCAAALVCLALIVGSFVYAPVASNGPVLCVLRLTTGVPCPSCGLTRSFCAVATGDLSGSLSYHLLGPLLFAACVMAIPLLFFEALSGRKVAWVHRVLFSKRTAVGLAAVLIVYHSIRLCGTFLPAIGLG